MNSLFHYSNRCWISTICSAIALLFYSSYLIVRSRGNFTIKQHVLTCFLPCQYNHSTLSPVQTACSGFKNTPGPYCVSVCMWDRERERGRKGEGDIQETSTISFGKTQMSLHITHRPGDRFAALDWSLQSSFPLFSPLAYLLGSDSCDLGNFDILFYFTLLLEAGLLFLPSFLSFLIIPPNTDVFTPLVLLPQTTHLYFVYLTAYFFSCC